MQRFKSKKSDSGVSIAVDGRGLTNALPGAGIGSRSSNSLYRESMGEGDDLNRDSIFNYDIPKIKKPSWIPKKVSTNCLLFIEKHFFANVAHLLAPAHLSTNTAAPISSNLCRLSAPLWIH